MPFEEGVQLGMQALARGIESAQEAQQLEIRRKLAEVEAERAKAYTKQVESFNLQVQLQQEQLKRSLEEAAEAQKIIDNLKEYFTQFEQAAQEGDLNRLQTINTKLSEHIVKGLSNQYTQKAAAVVYEYVNNSIAGQLKAKQIANNLNIQLAASELGLQPEVLSNDTIRAMLSTYVATKQFLENPEHVSQMLSRSITLYNALNNEATKLRNDLIQLGPSVASTEIGKYMLQRIMQLDQQMSDIFENIQSLLNPSETLQKMRSKITTTYAAPEEQPVLPGQPEHIPQVIYPERFSSELSTKYDIPEEQARAFTEALTTTYQHIATHPAISADVKNAIIGMYKLLDQAISLGLVDKTHINEFVDAVNKGSENRINTILRQILTPQVVYKIMSNMPKEERDAIPKETLKFLKFPPQEVSEEVERTKEIMYQTSIFR